MVLQRFKDAFGQVDFILMPGDMVGHGIDPHREEFTEEAWEEFQQTVQLTASLMAEAFPDTIVLPSLGNNDGEYHSSAPDESFKSTFYGFMYDTWFANFPSNVGIAANVKDTIMQAGYYRMDVNSSLAVLAMNSQYMDTDDDTSF